MSIDILYAAVLSMVLSFTIVWGLILGVGLILSLKDEADASRECSPTSFRHKA